MDGSQLNWNEGDWQRLGQAVYTSRSEQGLNQIELATKAGLSRTSLQKIERGASVRMTAVHAIARALDWPEDHAENVLAGRAGGRPSRASASVQPKTDTASDLPLAVAHELKEGPLIDSQVVELGEESGARMIIVLRGKEDMTPEEIENTLKEWKRMAKQMRMGDIQKG